jgi:hypothetical protein
MCVRIDVMPKAIVAQPDLQMVFILGWNAPQFIALAKLRQIL